MGICVTWNGGNTVNYNDTKEWHVGEDGVRRKAFHAVSPTSSGGLNIMAEVLAWPSDEEPFVRIHMVASYAPGQWVKWEDDSLSASLSP